MRRSSPSRYDLRPKQARDRMSTAKTNRRSAQHRHSSVVTSSRRLANSQEVAMPLKNYGVLKGKAVAAKREDGQDTPHYQVQIKAGGTNFRIAINVKSQEAPSELLFVVDQDFRHPITSRLPALRDGFTALEPQPGGSCSRLHPGKPVRSARDEGAPQLSSRPRQRPERPSGLLCQAGHRRSGRDRLCLRATLGAGEWPDRQDLSDSAPGTESTTFT